MLAAGRNEECDAGCTEPILHGETNRQRRELMTFGGPSAFGMKVALSDLTKVSGVYELETLYKTAPCRLELGRLDSFSRVETYDVSRV